MQEDGRNGINFVARRITLTDSSSSSSSSGIAIKLFHLVRFPALDAPPVEDLRPIIFTCYTNICHACFHVADSFRLAARARAR